MSLKWKFVIALTLIPMVSLGIFFTIVYNNFKTDRLATIFETTLTQSRLLGKLTTEKLSPILGFMDYWAEFYYRDPVYAETVIRTLRENTSNLKNISTGTLVEYDVLTQQVLFKSTLSWTPKKFNLENAIQELPTYSERISKLGKPIIVGNLQDSEWTIINKYKKDNNREFFVFASFKASFTMGRFAGQVVTNNFWVNDKGEPLAKNSSLNDDIIPLILKSIANGKSRYGSFQLKVHSTDYIVSYTIPNQSEIVLINLIKSSSAFEALSVLLDQSVLLLAIFVSLAGALGIILSKKLTSAIETLVRITQTLSKGTFNVRHSLKTGDEVEILGNSIIKMATDIQKLMDETKHLGRMESELQLAKEVQSTLFPENNYDSDLLSLRALTKSASECGGDWWSYFETDTDFYVIVADATGHGVPAALLTSAINSLTSLLATLKITSPSQMLAYMNNALHQTAKGKKSMTMSLIKINKETGLVRFANASHESPLILRDISPTTKFNQLTSLDNQKSQPLGYVPDSEYEEGEFQLQPNDTILMYTDGATDARNSAGQAWGERRFSKAVIDSILNNHDLDQSINQIGQSMSAHINSTPLVDDITIIVLQYRVNKNYFTSAI